MARSLVNAWAGHGILWSDWAVQFGMSAQVVVHNCARLYPGRVESGAETMCTCDYSDGVDTDGSGSVSVMTMHIAICFLTMLRYIAILHTCSNVMEVLYSYPSHATYLNVIWSFQVVWEQDSLSVCMYFWITNVLMHITFSENNGSYYDFTSRQLTLAR